MATQSIDWQCNNVVLVHYTEEGRIIELQRVTTTTGVELIDNSDLNRIQPMLYSSEEATTYMKWDQSGAPNDKNRKNASNAVFCFVISFYGLLEGYLCELILFDLFGCGS